MTLLPDLVLAALAAEAVALLIFARLRLSPLDIAGLLLPGALLVGALHLALSGAPQPAIALALLASLPVHLFDLRRRLRAGRA